MKNKLKKFLNYIGVNTKEDACGFSLFCIVVLAGLLGFSYISLKFTILLVSISVVVLALYFGLSTIILKIIDPKCDE
jgi:hypothetical protein